MKAPWLFLLRPALSQNSPVTQYGIVPCAEGEEPAGVEILWPRSGQRLRPTLTPLILRAKIWGFFHLKQHGHIMAVITGREDRADRPSSFHSLKSAELNIEVFGLQAGRYFVKAFLVDLEEKVRSCWLTHEVSFLVENRPPFSAENRSEALQKNLRMYAQGFRGQPANPAAFLIQPKSARDFAYVTILWSEDFVDNAIVWASGLIASGSLFRRICMVGRGRIAKSKLQVLAKCCCDIDITDPIRSDHRSSRYDLVLTKLRVLQLDRKGLRKIVMMDADTLVLQNIDELFWLPSPSATVNKDTLMGELSKPKLSAGVMVLEPDSAKFQEVMASQVSATSDFIEQDLLDAYFNHSYNIIPLTYNLYPELLDLMPFLISEDEDAQPPLVTGIKVVHFWHLFNPFQTTNYEGAQYLQLNAKLVHPQMHRWYDLFWRLHQRGLRRGAEFPEVFERWQRACEAQTVSFGDESRRFVPVLGMDLCRHVEGFASREKTARPQPPGAGPWAVGVSSGSIWYRIPG
ncbi:unnamed protein product, partial [Effrenium voratum]